MLNIKHWIIMLLLIPSLCNFIGAYVITNGGLSVYAQSVMRWACALSHCIKHLASIIRRVGRSWTSFLNWQSGQQVLAYISAS